MPLISALATRMPVPAEEEAVMGNQKRIRCTILEAHSSRCINSSAISGLARMQAPVVRLKAMRAAALS
jgi:hypothetical protein